MLFTLLSLLDTVANQGEKMNTVLSKASRAKALRQDNSASYEVIHMLLLSSAKLFFQYIINYCKQLHN